MVIEQRPRDRVLAGRRAWLARPQAGSYLVFAGDLLHGVLPGCARDGDSGSGGGGDGGSSGECAAGSADERCSEWRTTLIVAWWGDGYGGDCCSGSGPSHVPVGSSAGTRCGTASATHGSTHADVASAAMHSAAAGALDDQLEPDMRCEWLRPGMSAAAAAAAAPVEAAAWQREFDDVSPLAEPHVLRSQGAMCSSAPVVECTPRESAVAPVSADALHPTACRSACAHASIAIDTVDAAAACEACRLIEVQEAWEPVGGSAEADSGSGNGRFDGQAFDSNLPHQCAMPELRFFLQNEADIFAAYNASDDLPVATSCDVSLD